MSGAAGTFSEAGTVYSFSATSTVLNDSDESDDSPGPQSPMEILRGPMRLPRFLSAYFVERKYLNMPYPEFRDELPLTEEQSLVFKDFHLKTITIRDHLEQYALEVQCLIPRRAAEGAGCGNFPVHVRFHGGGFCTGSTTFKPWFPLHVRNLALEYNSIILMPRYRKMPECHGKEILNDVDIFWEWYQSPKLYSDLRRLLGETSPHGSNTRIHIDRSHLLVSGDSAGAFLATYSWLSQPYLRIKALYLQYPMLHAYTREAGQPYRGKEISEAEVQEFAELYCNHITDLKALGRLTPRTESIPPEGMDMAYILSSAKKEVVMGDHRVKISYWEWWFREPDILDRLEDIANRHDIDPGGGEAKARMHHRRECTPIEPASDNAELPEFFIPAANHSKPSYCPPMLITHGMQDTNVPFQDTLHFAALVKQLFPEAYIRLELRPEEAHGFDYALDELDIQHRWLMQLCMAIGSAWVPENACETSAIESCQEGDLREERSAVGESAESGEEGGSAA